VKQREIQRCVISVIEKGSLNELIYKIKHNGTVVSFRDSLAYSFSDEIGFAVRAGIVVLQACVKSF
jgi:hypothetical protein